MSKMNLLKNPVLQSKLSMNVENPSGNVLEEISEQDMSMQVGGTAFSFTCTFGAVCNAASKYLGNKGYVCTLTKECQVMCQ